MEELVLQNGIPVPQSLASMLVLAAKSPVCNVEAAGPTSGAGNHGNTADGNSTSTAAEAEPGPASRTGPADAAGGVAPDIGVDNAGAADVPGGVRCDFPRGSKRAAHQKK